MQEALAEFPVGQRVEIWWKKYKKSYTGRITGFSGGAVQVHYDDGDRRAYTLEVLRERVDKAAEMAAAAAAKPGRQLSDEGAALFSTSLSATSNVGAPGAIGLDID